MVKFCFLLLIMIELPFLIPLIVWAIIQMIKVWIDYIIDGKISLPSLRWSWWFPSVHSWLSSSITTVVFFEQWIHSIEFAICFIFSFLFWYDAMNVRYEAGKHAHYINNIRTELKEVLNAHEKLHFLKERLGHTPTEVLGWIIVWMVLTTFFYLVILW